MPAVVLLSSTSPLKLATELEAFGHRVWEALAVSEVLFLCEHHKIDAVIISHDVEQGDVIEKQLRGIVMRLKASADATYIDTELSSLFPGRTVSIQ